MTNRATALLVDDEPGYAEALRITLESEGIDCVSQTDMTSAIHYLEQNDVSVLVTDIMMPAGVDYPGIDSAETGFYLIREVKHRWPKLPVICLSVIGDQDKIRSLRRMNVRYLRKGETPLDTAVEIIRKMAGRYSF